MTSTQRNILNLLMFQAYWFACILGGNLIAVMGLLCYGLLYSRFVGNPLKQWEALLAILFCGGLMDAIMAYTHIITFNATEALPIWLACLWLGFATLFFHGLQWLRKFSLPVIALIGAILGPLTYWSGAQLSNNSLSSGLTVFIISYATAWAILLPLFTHIPRLIYGPAKTSP